MKIPFLLVFVLASLASYSYDSGIALTTEKGYSMQVYVNGKLFNKEPGKFVRVRSTPGLFHVEVRLYNAADKKWYFLKKEIRAEKGFELQYKISFVNSEPQMIEVQKYPVYSKYFLNPSLYNRHSVT